MLLPELLLLSRYWATPYILVMSNMITMYTVSKVTLNRLDDYNDMKPAKILYYSYLCFPECLDIVESVERI